MKNKITPKEALRKLEMSAVCDKNMTIEQAEELREIIERELKALEISTKKRVNFIIFCGCDTLEEYNKHPLSWWKLTQEEYDLLKEVLSYD